MFSKATGRLAATFLVSILLISPVFAENDDGTWEVGGFMSFFRFDPDSDLDSRFAPSVLVGYNFTKRHSGEFTFSTLTTSAESGPALDFYRQLRSETAG